ncbi:MAG: YqgE/AlgH family protein [Cytophagales bacterium]|nr:YqgE/AlgH family protein [Cytophagales bacterium]
MIQPEKGKILISEPFLPDPNFERTVVLVCDHNEDGTFGLVLNKPSNLKLCDVIEEVVMENQQLYLGGPVEQNTLHYIHRLGDLIDDSIPLGNNLYWSGNFEQVKQLINLETIQPEDIRFFIGYSGWSKGQLMEELSANSWFVSDANGNDIFDLEPEQLWRGILKKMGGKYKMYANFPVDPRLN